MFKGLLVFIFFVFVSFTSIAQQKEFGWLVGKWKLTEKNVFEEWKISPDHKSLSGISYQIKEGDTLVTERLSIKFEKPFFFYISDVAENPAPFKFKITQYNADKFLAENPEYDFPKAIRYKLIRKDNQDFIEAAIEGDDKTIPYNYIRLN